MRSAKYESEKIDEFHQVRGHGHIRSGGVPRSSVNQATRILATLLSIALLMVRMTFPANAVTVLSSEAYDPWNYTIVTFGDWQDDQNTSQGEHSTGPMAIGGNFTSGSYSFSDTKRPGASGMPQLIVSGNASGDVTGIGGDVYVKSAANVSGSWGYENGYELVATQDLPVDASQLKASFTALSDDIAAYASIPGNAITVTPSSWSTYLTGNNADLNVFNLDLSSGIGAIYLRVPMTSQIVINVTNSGLVPEIPQLHLYNSSTNGYAQVGGEPMEIDKRLIWNFSDATEIRSEYNTVHGAILAPNALLKLTGGNSNGTIIVDSYFGSSEFHWSSFDGDLTFVAQTPTPTSTPIPTPTSTPIPTPTSTPIPTPTSTPIPTPTSTPIPTPTSTPIPTPTSTPIPTPTSTPIPTPTSTPIPTPTSTPIPTPTPVNKVPSAVDDAFTTDKGNAITTTSVLENDDLGDEPTTVSLYDATSVHGGTVVYNEDGTFTYTPASGFSGTDTFTYTIEDADGETSTATVTITVTAAPTPTPTPSGVLGDTPEPVDAPSIHITAVPNKTVVVYGETVDYVLYITNNGNTDLENVTVSDAVLGISDYVVGDLRIGETRVLRSSDIPQLSYVVLPTVAVPVLTDSVVNGIPTNGASAVTSRDDTRVDIINIVITVTSDKTTISKGDSVTLTYRVTNEGTTDMTNVVLSDPNIGIVNYPIGSLRVGESVTVTSTVARGSVFVPPASSGSSVSSTPSATGSVATEGVTVTSTSSTNLIITIRTTSGTDIVKTGESNDVLIRIVSVALMAIGTLTIVGVLRKKRLS